MQANGLYYWDIYTVSKMLAAIKHIAAEIILFYFFFIRKQHIIALCMQLSPTAAAKNSI